MVPNPVFLLTLALGLSTTSLAVRGYSRRVDTPQLPFDPNTTPSCSDILSDWIISLDDFRRWNPSITAGCGGLETGKSYCVEAWGEPVPTTNRKHPWPTQSGQVETCNRWDLVQDGDTCSVYLEKYPGLSLAKLNLWVETYLCTSIEGWSTPTTTTATTTTSPPGNGIPTPTPTQPGMIADCNAFHEVKSGDTCASIAQSAGISVSQFTAWNSGVGTGCTSLAGNGIATPTPTLPGMVANCDAFYLVRSGDGCAAIASSKGISLVQLYAWNTNHGTGCTGCVSPTTTTKTTTRTASTTRTTTTQGNGVATPTPIQPGMTTSCKEFHKVVSGDQCGTIASKAGITLVNFLRWNPGVGGSACSSL
ncbi:hypothetical protein BDW71DRAFT_213866 [Aspergillus fruticulosus]